MSSPGIDVGYCSTWVSRSSKNTMLMHVLSFVTLVVLMEMVGLANTSTSGVLSSTGSPLHILAVS